jgi:CheY-like chemotaxis protein
MKEIRARWSERAQPKDHVLAHRANDKPRRILVIEDRFDTVAAMRSVLELSGYDVEVAYDGEGGIRKAIETSPDVILSDIELPGSVDGHGVAERLRAFHAFHSTYMVAVTGCAEEDDVKKALAAGFDLHLAKPPDMHVLLRLISEWFEDGEWPMTVAAPLNPIPE